jgi:hypothetical protein
MDSVNSKPTSFVQPAFNIAVIIILVVIIALIIYLLYVSSSSESSSSTGTTSSTAGAVITAGTGLEIENDIISILPSGVTPGQFTNPTLTINSQGQITVAANGATTTSSSSTSTSTSTSTSMSTWYLYSTFTGPVSGPVSYTNTVAAQNFSVSGTTITSGSNTTLSMLFRVYAQIYGTVPQSNTPTISTGVVQIVIGNNVIVKAGPANGFFSVPNPCSTNEVMTVNGEIFISPAVANTPFSITVLAPLGNWVNNGGVIGFVSIERLL